MLRQGKMHWFRRLGLAAVAAIGLSAIGVGAPATAEAQWYNPYYNPYYRPYYPRPYWNPYWPVRRGCPWGWHWAGGHWDGYGRWIPPGCRRNWW
jgi:hypothetical protein